ncbi:MULTISPECIES: GFA family protein [unclassified Inquilinus]|uniref:GFA family protein n=1 Tax=unclassified Inquilinus TaxID=2645927 RepID=UPI003F93BA04
MPFPGSCLCGAVRYEIDGLDMPVGHCHCTTCRKAHASAFTTTAGVLREHFRWIAGEDLLRDYESSAGKLRRFCSVCGTHLVADGRRSRMSSCGWPRSTRIPASGR